MLERMYVRWADAQGHRARVLDRQPGAGGGGGGRAWLLLVGGVCYPRTMRMHAGWRAAPAAHACSKEQGGLAQGGCAKLPCACRGGGRD